MAAPAAVPLTFVRGDDETVQVYLTSDSAGLVPIDISGRTYVMSIALTAGGTVVTSDAATVTGASGLATFVFAQAATDLLTASEYVYDVVETSSGSESTIMLGKLSVLAGVTA